MTQWQPIETYPDDIAIRLLVIGGRVFPGCFEHGKWHLVRPRYDAWCYVTFRTSAKVSPTHWMPIPPPPIEGKAE